MTINVERVFLVRVINLLLPKCLLEPAIATNQVCSSLKGLGEVRAS